jgi:hypothetical protein
MGQSSNVSRIADATSSARAKVNAAGDQVVSLSNPTALLAGIFAAITTEGALSVSMAPTPLLIDTFEGVTVDVTDRWTTSGTVPPTQVQGSMSVNPAATANATSALNSKTSFTFGTQITIGATIAFETGTTALGNHRFFGVGTPPSVPGTAAAPLYDAIGYEIDTAGVFRASIFNAGTRIFTQVLAMSTDGGSHRYGVVTRGDITYWFKDVFDLPVASSFVSPASQLLPVRVHSLNSAAVTGTPTLVLNGIGSFDQSRSAQGISDGTFPWRKARVDGTGSLATTARPADLAVSITGAAAAAVTCTLPAAGAGQFHYITGIEVTKYATVATTGGTTPVVVTTTNLPGPLAYTFDTAQAVGVSIIRAANFTVPLKSSVANTATTVVAPVVTSILWRITVYYYTSS